MRELERDHFDATTSSAPAKPGRLAILGAGRAGGSLAGAARAAGIETKLGARDVEVAGAHTVLLCVPDHAIRSACERIAPALDKEALVGHVSGATGLDALASAAAQDCPTFSLHPLQTIPSPKTDLSGAPCAVSASNEEALRAAVLLAECLGMRPFQVPEAGRAAYHAAASMASNFLVALEESAAGLMEAAGVADAREVLAPLVLRTAANWADAGAGALTGPIARGDEETVALHLEALAESAPELRPLYEALALRTREIAELSERHLPLEAPFGDGSDIR